MAHELHKVRTSPDAYARRYLENHRRHYDGKLYRRSTIATRVSRYGNWRGNIAENISYGTDVAREIVI
jgi:uncharacterized protein YkwD